MRRLIPLCVLVACALGPVAGAHWTSTSYAQTAASPRGDEFNGSTFAADLSLQCGQQAINCPDQASPTTWSLNTDSPGYLRLWAQPGTLVGTGLGTNNARDMVLEPVDTTLDYTASTSVTFPAANATPVLAL